MRLLHATALIALLLLPAACRTNAMPVPAELSSSEADAWPVSGRYALALQQTVTFGPYTAGPVDRAAIDVADDQSETHQTFGFAITHAAKPGVSWSSSCTDRAYRDDTGQEHGALECALVAPDKRGFSLKLHAAGERAPLSGTITDAAGTPLLDVIGTNRTNEGGASEDTTGYLITASGADGVIAAVDVSTSGYIWMRREQEDDTAWLTSTTAASLLLLRDLRTNF